MRTARVVAAFGAALLLLGAPPIALAQARHFVDGGGYQLDVVRAGHGSPVVVFEAGLGDALDDCVSIWPAIAKITTVVAYSRAGFRSSVVSF
jgi:hypothetical protein